MVCGKPKRPYKCIICNHRFPDRDGWVTKTQCPPCDETVNMLIEFWANRSRVARRAPDHEERVERYRAVVEAGGRLFE